MKEPLIHYGSERTSRVQPPMATRKFFCNLVIVDWTLNSIYVQFEYQCPKESNVSVEHFEVDVWILRTEGDA